MRVFVLNDKLIMLRNEKEEPNFGTFNTGENINKLLVNDFIISNYNFYKDKIIYDISVMDYIDPELYEIEYLDKERFIIKNLKLNVLGYVKIKISSNDNIVEIISCYIVEEENKKIYSDKILYTDNQLFKLIVDNYYSNTEFKFGEYLYKVERFEIFNKKIENTAMLTNRYLDDFYLLINDKNIYNEIGFCKRKSIYVLNTDGKIKTISGYERKINKVKKIFIDAEDIVDMNLIFPFEVNVCNSIFNSNRSTRRLFYTIFYERIDNSKNVNSDIKDKRRKIDLTSKSTKIEKLYIYDNIFKSKDETYEDITYLLMTKKGIIDEKSGYYLNNKKRYIISKDILGNYQNYVINIPLVDSWEKSIYTPTTSNTKKEGIYEKFNDASFLKLEFNYNVQEGTTLVERRDALERALKHYSKIEIISLINTFIKNNQSNDRKRNAVEKWKQDVKWVTEYNIDKQRKVKI